MLNLILGRAGSGKTTRLYDILKEKSGEDKEFIFLMPEQFSFETEKSIYRILGSHKAKNVKVLSFTRLAYDIFKQYGGLKTQLSDMQKQLLMAVTLNELKDNLTVYGDYKKNTAFVNAMVSTVDDFKAAGVIGENLRRASLECEEKELRGKLTDLSVIYTAYNAVLERCGADPKDNLTKAIEKASENGYFLNKTIFIDSFMAFSPAEMKMLSVIIRDAEDVYGSFCAPSLVSRSDVFAPVEKTLKKIMQTAKENGVKISAPVILDEQYRFENPSITALEQCFMEDFRPELSEKSQGVEVFTAENPYDEIVRIAGKIKKAVVEDGLKYREIAFITRDISRYEKLIPQVFDKFEIPYYMDKRVDIMVMPLVIGLKSAMDCVIGAFTTDNILKFAKSPLSSLTAVESAMLDNYCYTWSIKAQAWENEFTANPGGLSANLSEEDKNLLDRINSCRERVITPIIRFRKEIDNADGIGFAKAVYNMLTSCDAWERMLEFSKDMPSEKRKEFLSLQKALWDNIMDILDLFADLVGEIKMLPSTYGDLFNLCLNCCDLGQIPQTLDHVIIGQADRVRPDRIKLAFVSGCIDGEFPKQLSSAGILSDSERNKVTGLGLTLTADLEERESYENHYAYFALTRASQKLCVSYSGADLSGRKNEPSIIYTQVKNILGIKELPDESNKPENMVWNLKTAVESYGENYDSELYRNTLYRFITDEKSQMSEINLSDKREKHHISDRELSEKLFGRNMNISPSRLDEFYNCKFAYFAKNGLKIDKREKADITAVEAGKLIHYVMEIMVSKYGRNMIKLTSEELRNEINRCLEDYISENIDKENLTFRVKYLFEKTGDSLFLMMKHLARELAQTDFVPVYFEEKIGRNAKFAMHTIKCDDGTGITVEGKVDRVDIMEHNGQKYVRVVDYKSGAKEFKLSEVNYGLNMQMLIYLFAICPEVSPLADLKPAGILYVPSKNVISNVKTNMTAEKIEEEKDKSLKMSGLVLNDEAVIFGMEKSGEGVFIPVKMKKGEPDRYSSIISMNEMKRLKEKVEENIKEMAEILHKGNVEAMPTVSGTKSPCDYCNYRVACGRRDEDPVRRVIKISRQEMLGGEKNE